MAVDFYNPGDQEIHEGGQFYIPQEYYRLNKFNNTVAPMPMDGTQQITQEFGIPYTGAFTNAGGGGGLSDYGLDESNMKTTFQNVWNGSSWVRTPVTGYYDPASQTYKTKKGKNIVHGGLFTGDPKQGDIEGVDFEFPSITGGIVQWLKNKALAAKEKIGGAISGKGGAEITDAGTTIEGEKVYSGDPSHGAYGGGIGGIHSGEGTGGQTTQAAADLAGDSELNTPFAQGGRARFQPGGPAGGASAGGDYGGNVNPQQEYAGRTFAETYGGGGGGNEPPVNPVGPNYPAVGPMFNNEFAKRNRALALFQKQFEEDQEDNLKLYVNEKIPTSGYESLAGDLGKQRIEEKAAADIWKEYNTGGRVGFQPGGPAGGASAGGDYGGTVNPQQEYAGRTFAETYGGDGSNYNFAPATVPIKQIAMNEIMKKGAAQGGILGSVVGNIPQLMALKGVYDFFNKQRNEPDITEEDVIYGQNLRYGGLAGLL